MVEGGKKSPHMANLYAGDSNKYVWYSNKAYQRQMLQHIQYCFKQTALIMNKTFHIKQRKYFSANFRTGIK
jgi:hypothetical protein